MPVREKSRSTGEPRLEPVSLTDRQRQVADPQLRGSLFVSGPAGSGKTTAAVQRLRRLLEAGVRADSILVLLPQRTLDRPYREALREPALAAGAAVVLVPVQMHLKSTCSIIGPVLPKKRLTDPALDCDCC